MKRRFILGLVLGMVVAGATAVIAQIAISQLPGASLPLVGSEVVPGVQNGMTVRIPAYSLLSPFVSLASNIFNIPSPYPVTVGSPSGGGTNGAGSVNVAKGFFQNNIPIAASGYGDLADTSNNPSIVSGGTLITFDTSVLDSMGICSVSTYVCTPTMAGKYFVTCKLEVEATTGPGVGGVLLGIYIGKNGNNVASGSAVAIFAQSGSISMPVTSGVTTAIVSTNGTTDTFGCYGSSSSTGAAVSPGVNDNAMTYQYMGP